MQSLFFSQAFAIGETQVLGAALASVCRSPDLFPLTVDEVAFVLSALLHTRGIKFFSPSHVICYYQRSSEAKKVIHHRWRRPFQNSERDAVCYANILDMMKSGGLESFQKHTSIDLRRQVPIGNRAMLGMLVDLDETEILSRFGSIHSYDAAVSEVSGATRWDVLRPQAPESA
jgi:hypothetical protein